MLWGSIILGYLLCLVFLPHDEVRYHTILSRSVNSLLFLLSLIIFFKEPNKKNKLIFLNFVVFFFMCFLQIALEFVGRAFLTDDKFKYVNFLYWEYNTIAYILFLSIAIIYLVIDLLFRDFKALQKYAATLGIVAVFFTYYFFPIFSDPFYLYSTEDIRQWKTLDTYVENQVAQSGNSNQELPSAVELASNVKLQAWHEGVPVGDLYPEENMRRINELAPYLDGNNWKVLFFKPMFLKSVHINVMLIGFIILFFGYQYKKDPPQGAYIDKIMFLFLLFCSLEIVHNWGFIKSVEWSSSTEMFSIGQYVTVIIQLLMVLFFSLRLRFITSVQGEFYEAELASNPQHISRWRDWVDEIVLAKFFNFKIFNGRLFQNPSGK
jgi:hypothetical protein